MRIHNTTLKNIDVKSRSYVLDGLLLNLDAASYISGNWVDTVSGISFTLENSPVHSPSHGGIFTFTPASGQWAHSSESLPSQANWTVEIWHNWNNEYTGIAPCLLTELWPNTPHRLNFSVGTLLTSAPYFQSGFFTGYWKATNPGYILGANVWHHIIASYDGSTIKLIIDNTLASSTSESAASASGSQGIRLMRRWDDADYWGGDLGSVRIYNRALSDSEIAFNFNGTRARYGI